VIDLFCNENLGNYLYKRLRRPAVSEIELKRKLKKSFAYKSQFIDNRTERNKEYIVQRKRDFAVSQKRAQALVEKLQEEYENEVKEHLRRHSDWVSRTAQRASSLISESSGSSAKRICDTAVQFACISDALSFVPALYSTVAKWFHRESVSFTKESPLIPGFCVREYRTRLRVDTQKLIATLSEGCREASMIPPVVGRQTRAVCVLMKPLVFSKEVCADLAAAVKWRAVFGSDFEHSLGSLFSLLRESTEDVIVFGFPRHPQELAQLYDLFNPKASEEGFVQRPKATHIEPFDAIIELDIADDIVLSDVLAELVDSGTGVRYDVRTLTLDTEEELVRLRHVPDPYFDLEQYAPRSVTLKSNFSLIAESHRALYHQITIDSRSLNEPLIEHLRTKLDSLNDPAWPEYPRDALSAPLLARVQAISNDLKDFFLAQWRSIEDTYLEAVTRAFELLHETHRLMIGHLERSRHEMRQFLGRPASSQHLLIEFQQWHCTQVEREMRRMQRVKDECNMRLSVLREQLILIENERKSEEEAKQKDLTNAPFRATLCELANNAYTLLAQAEIDRWTATRSLLVDFNQIISDIDLVPHLPHRKLNLVIDPSRMAAKKGQKKPARAPTPNRNRPENKLQPFDSPLFEQLEQIKKFVADASVVYVRATTPVSVRQPRRPLKDKNPFAAHKITAIEEFLSGFADDDVYLGTKIDDLVELAHATFQEVQQAFDAFVDDSTNWIHSNYERRKSVADSATAYFLKKVSEEAQLNHLVLLKENKCIIDATSLIAPNEEMPKIPPAFPPALIENAHIQTPETFVRSVVTFISESEVL
jgi:hypothetical protein